jgi:hypothetical protein
MATTVCRFRAHSWIVRIAAVGIAIIILLPALESRGGGSSKASWPVIALLVGLGLLIPIALLLWDRQRGIHVREDGIKSVSANGSKFLAWSDIAAFEIADYVAGTIVVSAIREDGTCVALSDTARWPYQRKTVEHTRDQLAAYRERWAT